LPSARAGRWPKEHVNIDDRISGADFVRREGYLRLMNALTPHPPFQALVMMEQSRLGRSLDEVPYAIRKITEAGVRIFFYLTDTEVKRDTAVDRFQSRVMAFVDEMHREQSRQRTRDDLRRRAERGYVAGGIVYGYRNREVRVGDQRSHVVHEIDPAQAAVVVRIFREVAEGHGFLSIAKRLNAEGVSSPRPRRYGWASSGIRELVLRDRYRGRATYGKTRWEDHQGTKRKVDTPPSTCITVEQPELRIVDEDLWRAAHARLGETRKRYARLTNGRLIGRPGQTLESRYLLTGFLRCGFCKGSVYIVRSPPGGGCSCTTTARPSARGAAARAVGSASPWTGSTPPCSTASRPLCSPRSGRPRRRAPDCPPRLHGQVGLRAGRHVQAVR
jgi:site-specific DNA recombinase